ncbi:MAG TPA: DegV family protein [Candidatus Faecousia intestinigallinarum]|nr:DegV family protein [Candidatus Faecousia intestinigallinarum]
MSIKIVADSAANLFSLSGADFAYAPLKIVTAKAEYADTPELNVENMVEDVKATKGKSGTSCPNVAEWLNAFGDAEEVFAVTITSGLSGSYAAACSAALEYAQRFPSRQVCVVDSLSAGPEMALLVERLKDSILSGKAFSQIREEIRTYQQHTHLLFSLQSLTNLARNGRVSPAVAKIAGVLGIRVVGAASAEGTLEPLHKCRGERKAVETIFQEMVRRGFQGGAARIAHCFNPESAQTLKDMILERFPKSRVLLEPCTALCSFYAERGGLLVGFADGGAEA